MKTIVQNRIIATILLVGLVAIMVFVSDYVAIYFESRDRQIPSWVRYLILALFLPVLGLAYRKFIDSFKKGKGKKHADSVNKGETGGTGSRGRS